MSELLSLLQNHVRRRRVELSLSQAELARRAGLTRQAVSAIENGGYVPSAVTALQLARALDARVEDLFALPDAPTAGEAVHLAAAPGIGGTRRFVAARARGRLVAQVLTRRRMFGDALCASDGFIDERETAHVVTPPAEIDQTALILGCDPALPLLVSNLGAPTGGRLVALYAASEAALEAVNAGEAHVGGVHLDAREGEPSAPAAAALGEVGGTVVCFATWELGLAVMDGNPKGIRGVDDLARPDVWLANREPGSGARQLLDAELAGRGIPLDQVRGFGMQLDSHYAVARSVSSGLADAGICPRAIAETAGLGFVPIAETRFDLVVPADHARHPAVAAALDMLASGRFRRILSSLPGYSTARTGQVLLATPSG